MAVRGDLQTRERATQRDLDLQCDHVEPRHHLGDGVLDLDPRVHLQEVEGAVFVEDAFHRPGVDVAGLLRERDRGLGEPLAKSFVELRRRCLLDQLLMASLDGTVALAQEHDVDLGAAEVRLRLAGRALE